MANATHGRASFCNQAHALVRKNLIYQKRQKCDTCALFVSPVMIVLFLKVILDLSRGTNKQTVPIVPSEICKRTPDDFGCEIRNPEKWPPVMQIPALEYRAVRTDFMSYLDLPDKSCRKKGSCPVTILATGSNQSLGRGVLGQMFTNASFQNYSNSWGNLSGLVLGSVMPLGESYFFDPAFMDLYTIQQHCSSNSSFPLPMEVEFETVSPVIGCVQGLNLWRNSSSDINDELINGYSEGNTKRQTNEIAAAYDFLDSKKNVFSVIIWCNSTYKLGDGGEPDTSTAMLLRVPQLVNLASNAYLRFLRGPGTNMLLEFIKDMPKHNFPMSPDLSIFQLFASLAFTLQLQIAAKALVYEKQRNIRIMMKMHGLGDRPYWTVTYAFHLILSTLSILCFLGCGKLFGIFYITKNDYGIQFIFYFIYASLQVSLSFLAAAFFSNIRTVSVVCLVATLVAVLAGNFIFNPLLKDPSCPSEWIFAMELFPFFSLFRGLYEFEQYAIRANKVGAEGMRWKDLTDSMNGMREVIIIMIIECLAVIFIAYYVDQVVSSGSGVRKSPLFFLGKFGKKPFSPLQKPTLERHGSQISKLTEKADVVLEREKVEQLLLESSGNHAIVCGNLKKVYPGRDGNPPKVAVKGLSLALPRAECFGMLGPNGAGKTSLISMMIGLTEPTSGTAFVQGLDIRTFMDEIYSSMGVCPQQDLLWDCLTGREHLLFYGRLKNLKGGALMSAVEESLKNLNLFNGGVADKEAGKYSGGMKRRLSVAISLIGDPKVVYMDEPSTGLDPASRNNLWNILKHAKQDRAIILTTHSMEEAEAICDRIGIFVNGSLQCIGNAKELRARYGGTCVFTMTTTSECDAEVEKMVRDLCRDARKIYHLPGTQKFELPKQGVRIADVFELVENAKGRFTVHAWGLADTTLEDVFIKVTQEAEASEVL
ncbi:hypothetical protein Nepgr_033368 [Nepenthes gracilis]|uniref:ABC transporter domain-containing protein n=1 Tax=Nepenthes gracilis TaxID=150966 RepID=A0AAD3TL35_NEPGR|nr:hypothetical protein Nepgr_033368 [Nepenthes gracilis]